MIRKQSINRARENYVSEQISCRTVTLSWGAMAYLSSIALPTLTTRDLWRWGLIAMGALLIAHGFFSKHMRMRDSRTWEGALQGKIVTKPWQIAYMRGLFILIGGVMIFCALSPTFP